MTASSEIQNRPPRVPLSDRLEFADVIPVAQNDGPNPVVPIAYTDAFAETMNYFRALYLSDERSSRALALTEEAILMNAGNYTVWHFRRLIIEALDADFLEELKFVASATKSNPKNYQIWHHRRWLVEKLGSNAVSEELEFTKSILSLDAKNYHAWSHRQWVLQALGGWENELEYCQQLLADDVFNNSAWNQRYFVITRCPFLGGLDTLRDSEVDYTIDAIGANPGNESAWRYLQGLYKGSERAYIDDARVTSVCLKVLNSECNHVFGLSTLLDLLIEGFKPGQEFKESVDALKAPDVDAPDSSLAETICSVLQHIDSMRANYWTWRRRCLPRPVQ